MDTAQSKNSLLLVDGDPKSLRVLDVSLKKAGFEVSTASSGQEALSALEAGIPDLIISDTDLAEMDGFELCRQIKARTEWSKIPFIFVSGRKSIEDKIRGLELGVDDYLTKPIYIKEIGIRVRTALQRAERERMESRRDGRTRFAGDLADVGVVDLVQTIELNRKSGIVHIVSRDNRRGSIFFRDGKVIDAEVGRLSGANAIYRLFSWSEGQFAVEFKQIRRHDVIDLPMAALLMEGMRRLDESTHLLEGFPSSNGVLEVDCRVLAEELAELPDEMNSVLRLCDGARTLPEVVDDCDHPDLEALTIIDRLYKEHIIFAREAPDRSGVSEPGERLARWLSEGEDEDGAAVAKPTVSPEPAIPLLLAQSGNPQPTGRSVPIATESLPDRLDLPSATPQPDPEAPTTPLDQDLSGEETLAAALALESESSSPASNEFLPSVDTLKGLPLDNPFAEHDGKSGLTEQLDPETALAVQAIPAVITTSLDRMTKPLGVAERLLSEDSALRASAMHEAIAEAEAKVGAPAQSDRTTREYGRLPSDDATTLVEEAVSASHATKRVISPAPEPERPQRQVDWGAWAAVAAPGDSSLEDALSGVAPRPVAGGAASSDSSSESVPISVSPELSPEPMPLLVLEAPKYPLVQASEPATVSHQQTLQPPEMAAAGPSAQPTAAPVEKLLSHQAKIAIATRPDRVTKVSTKTKADRGSAKKSQPSFRLLILLAAVGLGLVGYRLLTTPKDDLGEGTASPMLPPEPSSDRSSDRSSDSSSDPSTMQVPRLPDATPKVVTTVTPTDSIQPTRKSAASVPSVPAALTSELRQRCLAADADGKGKAKAVAAACRTALNAEPNAPDILVVLARAELDRGRLAEAKALAKRALAIDPQRLEAYVFLGNAEQEAGKTDEARAAYKKYLELAPSGPFARELRSILNNL